MSCQNKQQRSLQWVSSQPPLVPYPPIHSLSRKHIASMTVFISPQPLRHGHCCFPLICLTKLNLSKETSNQGKVHLNHSKRLNSETQQESRSYIFQVILLSFKLFNIQYILDGFHSTHWVLFYITGQSQSINSAVYFCGTDIFTQRRRMVNEKGGV